MLISVNMCTHACTTYCALAGHFWTPVLLLMNVEKCKWFCISTCWNMQGLFFALLEDFLNTGERGGLTEINMCQGTAKYDMKWIKCFTKQSCGLRIPLLKIYSSLPLLCLTCLPVLKVTSWVIWVEQPKKSNYWQTGSVMQHSLAIWYNAMIQYDIRYTAIWYDTLYCILA